MASVTATVLASGWRCTETMIERMPLNSARASSFSRSMRAAVSESGRAVNTLETRRRRARADRAAVGFGRWGNERTARSVSTAPEAR